jgi:isochorismate synthase
VNSGGAPVELLAQLGIRAALEQCADRADVLGAPQYLAIRQSVSCCDPLLAFSHSADLQRYFWEHPAGDHALAALGCVCSLDLVSGAQHNRFTTSSMAAQRLFDATTVVGAEDAPDHAGPLLLGGFSFSAQHTADGEWEGFPASQLVLAETLLVRIKGCFYVTLCREITPACDREAIWLAVQSALVAAKQRVAQASDRQCDTPGPSPLNNQPPFTSGAEYRVVADREHAVYRRQVVNALRAIDEGLLEKVVMARSLRVEHPGQFAVPALLGRLRQLYPDCVTMACARSGGATFVSASPERLVSLDGDRVVTGALAGSAPRGSTPEEDARLGTQLQRSAKERAEHAAVLRAIHAALAKVCWPLQGARAPELMRLEGIQHLHTPLSGRLLSARGDQAAGAVKTVIDLVGLLHPTPAVGGLPATEALQWIEQREGLQRGWFGGPVGFIDRRGSGEFWVALRSGLIRNPVTSGDECGPARASSGASGASGTSTATTGTAIAVARLYAGAGIVKGSCPEQELRETRLKLRALLAPLTEI